MRIPCVDTARVAHHLAHHGGLAARRGARVQHGLARLCADHARGQHGAFALNRKQAVLESAHAGHVARAVHLVYARQNARLKFQLVVGKQAAQSRVVAAQIVHADGYAAVFRAVAQNFHRIVLAVSVHQHPAERLRRAEHDGKILHRVLLRLGPDHVVLAADHVAQHAVDQPGQRLQPHRAGQADGLVHRRHIRHAVQVKQLIRAHAQNFAHGLVDFLVAFEELIDAPVERHAVFQRAVDQLGHKRAVAARQIGLSQPLIQRQRGIRVRTADVQQRFQRHAPRRKVHRARLTLPARRAEAGLAVAECGLVPMRAVRLLLAKPALAEFLFAVSGLVAEFAFAIGLFVAKLLFSGGRLIPPRAVGLLLAELALAEFLFAVSGPVAARLSVRISICAAETAVAPSVVCH